jgi:hypothetical protein
MLLPKIIDTINMATAKTQNDSMYALTHVQVEPTRISASNKASLYYADIPEIQTEIDDYQQALGMDTLNAPTEYPVLLPNNIIDKAIRNRPKKGGASPVLTDNIMLTETVANNGRKDLILSTTDLKSVDKVVVKDEYRDYPDIDSIISPTEKDYPEPTGISLAELELLVKMMKKAGLSRRDTAAISMKSPTDPIKIDCGEFKGIIMPCQL